MHREVRFYDKNGFHLGSGLVDNSTIESDVKLIFWRGLPFYKMDDDRFINIAWAQCDNTYFTHFDRDSKKIEGDDSYLFGLPENILDAADDYLSFFSSSFEFYRILELTEKNWVEHTHSTHGQYIRKAWYFWWVPGHAHTEWPKSIPPLVEKFHNIKIFHPEDMSRIIIGVAYQKANGATPNIERLTRERMEYWKTQGFPDGIFKHTS